MNLRVLGCSGGSARGHFPTSFLIDGRIAVDAGAVTTNLPPEEQEKIDHVVLSHAHLDHVSNLPFLLDNRFARQTRPIAIWGPEPTLAALRTDIFNNRVWPDFTILHNRKSVSLELKSVAPGTPFQIESLSFRADPMVHPVPCFGYRIDDGRRAIYIAGDTGDATAMKSIVSGDPSLRAIAIEVSWPDRMHELAKVSGHLTTAMLSAVWPIHPTARILITHIKPFYIDEVKAELAAARLSNVIVLEDGMAFDF